MYSLRHSFLILAGALTLALSSPPRLGEPSASVPVASFDPARLQADIDAVLERALPATVGVHVGDASGSGVIVSPDGLVLTAAHVIGGAGRKAKVFLADGTLLEGLTLGANHVRDSGLLRILDARDLPHVEVPPPGAPAVGDWCLALGHPGGFESGRPAVPRLGRILDPAGRFPRTDCALIGGDSGGPLFDLDGRLIGIHSRIEPGIASNFHVPLATFRLGWKRLLAGEEWSRRSAWLGAGGVVDAPRGALLGEILPGRAAARAGLRAGDVVVAIEGEIVHGANELIWMLADLLPGDAITVAVARDAESLELPVVLGAEEREEQRR